MMARQAGQFKGKRGVVMAKDKDKIWHDSETSNKLEAEVSKMLHDQGWIVARKKDHGYKTLLVNPKGKYKDHLALIIINYDYTDKTFRGRIQLCGPYESDGEYKPFGDIKKTVDFYEFIEQGGFGK